jgi:NAD(P)-dependent dehydrogenase (short-subunit alcohol dehydrogenase family)
MSFAGKVAFVAGAGGGMGLAIAEALLAEGAQVALADVKPAPAGLRQAGDRHRYFEGDLTHSDFVSASLSTWTERNGRLDYLVNTTGRAVVRPGQVLHRDGPGGLGPRDGHQSQVVRAHDPARGPGHAPVGRRGHGAFLLDRRAARR